MTTMTVEYDEQALSALGKTREEIEAEMRVRLAAKMYERAELSLGQAAKLAGIPKVKFMFRLGELGVPVINLSGPELDEEFRVD